MYGYDDSDTPDYSDEEDEEDEVTDEEDDEETVSYMDTLVSPIRTMFRNSNIENFYISTKGYDVSIQIVLNKRERFGNLMRVLGLLKKISTDIFIQYDSELRIFWKLQKETHF
jgi:hypothetical protein